jgi:hypothetical protein
MKVYILTAIDTICNEGTQIFSVHATRERAEAQIEKEIEAYGGIEECDFEFEILEKEVKE